MKCPKCGYNSFEFLDSCKKCNNDLKDFKQSLGIRPIIMPSLLAPAGNSFGGEVDGLLDVAGFHASPAQAVQPAPAEGDFEFDMDSEPAPPAKDKEIFPDLDLDFSAPAPATPVDESGFSFDQEPFPDIVEPAGGAKDEPVFGDTQLAPAPAQESDNFPDLLEEAETPGMDDPFGDLLESSGDTQAAAPAMAVEPAASAAPELDMPWDLMGESEPEPAKAEPVALDEQLLDDGAFELESFAWEEPEEKPVAPAAKGPSVEPEGFSREELEALFGEGELAEEEKKS